MDKAYFYSYHILKGGVKVAFGHGVLSSPDGNVDEEIKKEIRKDNNADGDIHLIALNNIN